MKRPAFQFYSADWLRNLKLRRCSAAAQGTWISLLCHLHESEEYGVFRWPLSEVASTCHLKIHLLRQLVDRGVLKGSDGAFAGFVYVPSHAGRKLPPVTLVQPCAGPVWFCSRFLKDEWLRSVRGASTRFTMPITMPRQGERQGETPSHGTGVRLGDGASSAVALPTTNNTSRDTTGAPPDHHFQGISRTSTSTQPHRETATDRTTRMLEQSRATSALAAPPPGGSIKDFLRAATAPKPQPFEDLEDPSTEPDTH
mgnify:CR=1 FL=1